MSIAAHGLALHAALSGGDGVQASKSAQRLGGVLPPALRRPLANLADVQAEHLDLFRSARSAFTNVSMDWLNAQAPEAIPNGALALEELGKAVQGVIFLSDPLRVADWLVAHSDVVAHLTPTHHQALMHQATRPKGTKALVWMLRPDNGLPTWRDDPREPLLTEWIRRDRRYPGQLVPDLPDFVEKVGFLLAAGVTPKSAPPTETDPHGSSPLHQLILGFDDHVRISNEAHVSLDNRWIEAVLTLWPLLLKAGDDRHRPLRSTGPTVLERVIQTAGLWRQLENVTLALDRTALADQRPPPARHRPRPRS